MTDTLNNNDETIETKAPEVNEVETGEEAEPRSNEAKKYRLKLREVEAERDALKASLSASRQALFDRNLEDFMTVEYQPAEGMSQPSTPDGTLLPLTANIKLKHISDFATFTGLTVDDLSGEDGGLDKTKVNDALVNLWHQRGELFEQAKSDFVVHTIGQNPGTTPPKKGFDAAFSPTK